MLDLLIAHERCGSTSRPSLHDHLHYPADLDRTLNEVVTDKVLQYRADHNNRPPHAIAFMPPIASTSGSLHSEFVRLLFLQAHRETVRFLATSGVHLVETNHHFRRTVFTSQLKSKVGHILTNTATLWINLNIDGAPRASRSRTHPSHTQNSRLLTSSLSPTPT